MINVYVNTQNTKIIKPAISAKIRYSVTTRKYSTHKHNTDSVQCCFSTKGN